MQYQDNTMRATFQPETGRSRRGERLKLEREGDERCINLLRFHGSEAARRRPRESAPEGEWALA